MNKVKEEPVSYSTYQGKHKKFYRQIYFEYICLLINSFKLLVRPMQRQDNANLTNENLIHQIE